MKFVVGFYRDGENTTLAAETLRLVEADSLEEAKDKVRRPGRILIRGALLPPDSWLLKGANLPPVGL